MSEEMREMDKEYRNMNTNWCPDKCPITGRDFFMWIEHIEKGMVPTYGGPFDSYTIPEMDDAPDLPYHERELICGHYDHDAGCWKEDEILPLRICHEKYIDFDGEIEGLKKTIDYHKKLNACYAADRQQMISDKDPFYAARNFPRVTAFLNGNKEGKEE